jgi:hypothetical protein
MSVSIGSFGDDFPMIMEVDANENPAFCPPLAVSFGMHPVKDGAASKKAGHDVFKDVEHVKIVVPGDKFSLHFQPATQRERERFPKAYAAFKARETKAVQGMPIEQWAPINRSLALTLKACHIDTVEALAAVHDSQLDKFGFNVRELRNKAIAWLADSQSGAAALSLAAEKQALEAKLAAMQEQIAALTAANAPAPGHHPVAPKRDTTADVEHDVAAAARRPRARAA